MQAIMRPNPFTRSYALRSWCKRGESTANILSSQSSSLACASSPSASAISATGAVACRAFTSSAPVFICRHSQATLTPHRTYPRSLHRSSYCSFHTIPCCSNAADSVSGSSAASSSIPALPPLPLFQRMPSVANNIAISIGASSSSSSSSVEGGRITFTYASLMHSSGAVARLLQDRLGSSDLRDHRVAFLYGSSFDYVCVLLGIWRCGGIAVPLHQAHPPHELGHLVRDSGASCLVAGSALRSVADKIDIDPNQACQRMVWDAPQDNPSSSPSGSEPSTAEPLPFDFGSNEEFLNRRALFIYTSGTTGKPKGVVWTHRMLDAQMSILTTSWAWSSTDHILHILPLHHVHGVINALCCALYAGARISFLTGAGGVGKVDTEQIARAMMDESRGINVFMAVPTIYARLIALLNHSWTESDRQQFASALSSYRLLVSGSAALPESIREGWSQLTRNSASLLERYGMSETGMILSQPYELRGSKLVQGTVGLPLPTVEIKIVPTTEESDKEAEKWAENRSNNGSSSSSSSSSSLSAATTSTPEVGELRVRGPSVFREYWQLPSKTHSEFDCDGFFKTGDIVSRDPPGTGFISILGRASVDILKSGGYKLSALEVERQLLSHPDIEEVAVVGIPDVEYGQVVGAILKLRPSSDCASSPKQLQAWCRTRLASYAIPRKWKVVKEIPRNAMGKVNKKQLIKLFEEK